MLARALLIATALLIVSTAAASAESAKAMLKNAEGADVGRVSLTQVDDGVLLRIELKGLPPGDYNVSAWYPAPEFKPVLAQVRVTDQAPAHAEVKLTVDAIPSDTTK